MKIFEDSDVLSLVYDLTMQGSYISNFEYLITDLDIISLDYASKLPNELASYELNAGNLKNYISFFKDGYIVGNENINVYIEDIYTGSKKIKYIVAYEEGLYAYSGYYEQVVVVTEVPIVSETTSDYDILVARNVVNEIGGLYLTFDKVICTYKSKNKEDRHIQNLISGNGNTFYCETNKSKNKKYAILVTEKV